MKSLFVAFALFATCSAFAASSQPSQVYDSKLISWNLDPHAFPGRVEGGFIRVDLANKTVSLTLEQGFYCPAGQMCAQVMPAPRVITLPIVSQNIGNCGVREIIAQRDMRPVDGNLQALRITDNTHSVCDYYARNAVTGELRTESLRGGKTQSFVYGNAFQRVLN